MIGLHHRVAPMRSPLQRGRLAQVVLPEVVELMALPAHLPQVMSEPLPAPLLPRLEQPQRHRQ